MADKSSKRKHEYKLAKLPDRGEDLVAALNEFAEEGWEVEHLDWDPTTHVRNTVILRRDI